MTSSVSVTTTSTFATEGPTPSADFGNRYFNCPDSEFDKQSASGFEGYSVDERICSFKLQYFDHSIFDGCCQPVSPILSKPGCEYGCFFKGDVNDFRNCINDNGGANVTGGIYVCTQPSSATMVKLSAGKLVVAVLGAVGAVLLM